MVVIVTHPGSSKHSLISSSVENKTRMEVSVCLDYMTIGAPVFVESVFNVNGEMEFIQALSYVSVMSPLECVILQDGSV